MASSANKDDYYEVLEVLQTSTFETIKASYRKLALKCHPDKNPGNTNATEAFQKLGLAWETLKDDVQRHAYDREYPQIKEAHERADEARRYREAWEEWQRTQNAQQEAAARDYAAWAHAQKAAAAEYQRRANEAYQQAAHEEQLRAARKQAEAAKADQERAGRDAEMRREREEQLKKGRGRHVRQQKE